MVRIRVVNGSVQRADSLHTYIQAFSLMQSGNMILEVETDVEKTPFYEKFSELEWQ